MTTPRRRPMPYRPGEQPAPSAAAPARVAPSGSSGPPARQAPAVERTTTAAPPTAPQATAAPVTEPRFDPSSWLGAIILMGLFTAGLWIVQIANKLEHYSFNRFGLRAREISGLWGVLTQPFLHQSYRDMLADTLPVLLLGWALMLAGVRIWLAVTAFVVLVGGILTWACGPGHLLIVGSSSLVFGWIGYLVARAVFSRKIRWIISAAMVLLIFGALLGQLVPVSHSQQSWQAHVCGFAAGAIIGALLHRRRRPVAPRRAENAPVAT